MAAASFALPLRDLLGTWGRPPDDPAKIALGITVVAAVLAVTRGGRSILGAGEHMMPRRLFLWVTAFSAALLSIGYVAIYLRGGPRIIDATSYFLQGRALSHGDFAWPVEEPTASFRGRFLLSRIDGESGGPVLGGIFPPGYPMLLALGFAIGAPMVVGPVIAAALVVATYRLARTLAESAFGEIAPDLHAPTVFARRALVEPIARTAALLSVACAALRYHTADTMSHGATALGIVIALDAALKKRATVAGLAVGAVIATRPVSALAIGLVTIALLVRGGADARPLPWFARFARFAAAALPGIGLLLVAQHAVTGAWFTSAQRMYYATSDGPPGCFRWGFGAGAGCLYEHGDFVEAHLVSGHGLASAAGATLRRLHMHLLDVANLEPLTLLLLVPLVRMRAAGTRSVAVVAALVLVGLHVLAYAPFYFDGDYPGGGARFFAELLPVEHALLAVALGNLLGSVDRYRRGAFALLALVVFGFAVHGVFGHLQLADRDGGRPMYEQDFLARSAVADKSLVFVDTDHAFNLGHDPEARIKSEMVIARLRNDDRDRMLFDRLEHPKTYKYSFEIPAAVLGERPPQAVPVVVAWSPPALGSTLRFEAEAEWPAIAQSGGFAAPIFTDACASGGRALALTPSPIEGRARATITVPVPEAGRYAVGIRVVNRPRVPHVAASTSTMPPRGALRLGASRWDWVDVEAGGCTDLSSRETVLASPSATLILEAMGGAIALDRVTLRRVP